MANKLSREGHRQRIRDSYIESGLNGLQNHNILELILTYAIPRRDVKETAYALLNRFDNDIGRVFSADISELCEVNGIGESAAVLIKMFGELPNYIERRADNGTVIINDYLSSKEYAKTAFSDCTENEYRIICLDNAGRIISCDRLCAKEERESKVTPYTIIESMIKRQAAYSILVHIKPDGSYEPDGFDDALIKEASKAFRPLGISINDFIIVGKDGTFVMSNDIYYVSYFD